MVSNLQRRVSILTVYFNNLTTLADVFECLAISVQMAVDAIFLVGRRETA